MTTASSIPTDPTRDAGGETAAQFVERMRRFGVDCNRPRDMPDFERLCDLADLGAARPAEPAGEDVERVAFAMAKTVGLPFKEGSRGDAEYMRRLARAALAAFPGVRTQDGVIPSDQASSHAAAGVRTGMLRAAEIAQNLRHDDYSAESEDWTAGTEAAAKAIRAQAAAETPAMLEAPSGAAGHGADDGWRPIETAPRDGTEVELRRATHWKTKVYLWTSQGGGSWLRKEPYGYLYPEICFDAWRPAPPSKGDR